MDNEKFLVESGLYDKYRIGYDDYSDIINLLSGEQKIDLYCTECKEKRTFFPKKNKIKTPQQEAIVRYNVFEEYGERTEEDEAIYKSIKAQEEREEQERFKQFLDDNKFTVLKYTCSRDETHHMYFILFIDGLTIQKIGQYPSYGDIDLPQADTYRKELGKHYYNELKRAIGLFSCNVGIGSFVYL